MRTAWMRRYRTTIDGDGTFADVLPNFITSIAGPRSIQVALSLQHFSIEKRRPRSAPDGVMREHSEFPVQDAAGTQPPDGHRHARAPFHVETRLGTVRCLQINERRLRSAGQPELLGR